MRVALSDSFVAAQLEALAAVCGSGVASRKTHHLHGEDVLVVELVYQVRHVWSDPLPHARGVDAQPLVSGDQSTVLLPCIACFLPLAWDSRSKEVSLTCGVNDLSQSLAWLGTLTS